MEELDLLEIKKSKFLSYVFNVSSTKQVEDILNKIKDINKKATHICYAYVINSNGNYEKCFDDKEPSGYAGKPILNVIKMKKLTNILIVVVRYFGGIKLGSGGLIKAYSKSASNGVNKFNEIN